MEVKNIAPGYQEVQFPEDGNTVLYSYNTGLYLIDDLSSSTEPILLGEIQNLLYFKANDNLSEIYYGSEYGNIFHLSREGYELVYENGKFFRASKFIVLDDYFYLVSSTSDQYNYLYCSKHGEALQKISSCNGPCFLHQMDGTIYYEYENDGIFMAYQVKDGKLELLE